MKVFPDLGTIIRLSKALNISTGLIFDNQSGLPYTIIRKDERRKIARNISGKKSHPHYEYLSLSSDVISRHMESFIVRLTSNVYNTQEISSHEGEEFLYVLEGAIKIKLADKEETLSAGDSIFYAFTNSTCFKKYQPQTCCSSGSGVYGMIYPLHFRYNFRQ